MSDYTKELHDPAVETHLDDAHLEDNAASSGILLEKADYETGHSPEVTSLASSAILADEDDDHVLVAASKPTQAPKAHSEKTPSTTLPATTPITTTSTALATTEDLNQTMPWKLLYPIASRETILALLKATAINFMLPFINGVFLGFGEICAHELAFRWGWTNSTHVVNVAGRSSPRVANVGVRAGGTASGSRSGIGGLDAYQEESNKTTTTYSH